MLIFCRRRSFSSIATAQSPAVGAVAAVEPFARVAQLAQEPSAPIRMQEVIRATRRYGRRVAAEVGAGFILTVVSFGLLYGVKASGSIEGAESLWAELRLDVSPQTGLSLLGLLIALAIGLQVSVRGMPGNDDTVFALGRQLAIENTARVAGPSRLVSFSPLPATTCVRDSGQTRCSSLRHSRSRSSPQF
jgi:hypothetical protein